MSISFVLIFAFGKGNRADGWELVIVVIIQGNFSIQTTIHNISKPQS